MRTKNSMYNIIGAMVGQVCGIIAQFIGRLVFLNVLNTTYLGISGLFSNILSVLSLVELGAGTAMTYSLYKPIADGDISLIQSLMVLYRKIYIAIGIAILGLGAVLTPLYPYFIDEIPDIKYLTLYYWIYVLNTALTYFFSYKRILIICDQKKYINSLVHYGIYAVTALVQCVVLIVSRSYLAYLLCVSIFTIVENMLITLIANHKYPYLKQKNVKKLPSTELNTIKRNISAMMCHKIGGIVVSSTDNIIISKFLGLVQAGLYSNYLLITDALTKVVLQVFQALTASVGNLLVGDNENHNFEVFKKIFFMNAWIYGCTTTCLFCLFQMFIRLYVGESYLLQTSTVTIICVNFYFIGMRKTVLTFRDASATYYYDRYKALIEAVLNLFFSIWFVKYMGITGVFLGTFVSMMLVSIWVEPYVLFKHVLHRPLKEYIKNMSIYTLTNFIFALIAYIISNQICIQGICGILIKSFVVFMSFNTCFVVLWHKSEELRYFEKLTLHLGRKIINKE